jgi:hypothetical protein
MTGKRNLIKLYRKYELDIIPYIIPMKYKVKDAAEFIYKYKLEYTINYTKQLLNEITNI